MSSILGLICRKIAQKIVQIHGAEEVGEGIAKFGLDTARKFEASEIPEKIGMEVAQDFLRRNCQTGTGRAPWLMVPPIIEGGEMVFKTYFPTKGEIVSLYNRAAKAKVRESGSNSPSFSSSLSSSSRVAAPWLMLPPEGSGGGGGMVYKFYSVAEGQQLSFSNRGGREELEFLQDRNTKLVGSSHGWLASFNERSRDMFLSNPLSGRRISLPPVREKPSKVIISHSPNEQECRALMSFGLRRLAFCTPGRSKEWTPIGALYNEYYGLKCVRSYEDFVYSTTHKRFFSVIEDENSTVQGWDLGDPMFPRLDWKPESEEENNNNNEDDCVDVEEAELTDKDWCRPVKYLVYTQHSNQLYLVTRYITEDTKTIDFDVHRIDSRGRKLCYMNNSLDGLVMFVGINHSFALPASEFPGLKPNSIYFTGGHDSGIFYYENRTCCPYNLFNRIQQPAPLWFTPTPD